MTGLRISVILPVFNAQQTIARAVASVLGQSFPAFELIVVDDGSTDGTHPILESFGERIRLLEQNHRGPEAARNLALGQARGEYIAFLDADDYWLPEKLERQMALFAASPELALVFGDGLLVDRRSKPVYGLGRSFFVENRPHRGRVFAQLAAANFIPQSSVVVRRSCLGQAGPFQEIAPSGDYHKWLQIARRHRLDYVAEIVFHYAVHDTNSSRDRIRRAHSTAKVFELLLAEPAGEAERAVLRKRRLQAQAELALAELGTGAGRILALLGQGGAGRCWLRLLWICQVLGQKIAFHCRRWRRGACAGICWRAG